MYICHYIASYLNIDGDRVSVFHRGNYLYELVRVGRHLRWFENMSLDEVVASLQSDGYATE